MADLSKVELFAKMVEVYGVAVRAGLITPNLEDERAIRKAMDLPEPPAEVIADWARTKGVRAPITLSSGAIATDKAITDPNATDPPPDPQQ